jgi:hypothetical protein
LPGRIPESFDSPQDEKKTNKLAKDFVRWCFSFGSDFHNSPDLTNLRFWARKTKCQIPEGEEPEVIAMARPLFFRRIEQHIKKAEAAAN